MVYDKIEEAASFMTQPHSFALSLLYNHYSGGGLRNVFPLQTPADCPGVLQAVSISHFALWQ